MTSYMNNRTMVPTHAQGILDFAPGAAAAYSLRNLSYAYNGPVVTVRRSTDSAEADFTATEVSDGTLAAWCGGGDGFVKQWWDQSGKARHASQATTASQPQIVSAGVVILEGGKPTLQFDGVDDRLTVASSTAAFNFLHDGRKSAVVCVARLGASANPDAIYAVLGNNGGGTANVGVIISIDDRASGSANNRLYVFVARGVGGTSAVLFVNNNTITPLDEHIVTVLFDVANPTAALRAVSYVDGAFVDGGNTSTSSPSAANATYDLQLGSQGTSGALLLGTISELLIYPRDMTAERQLVEGSMAWYF